MTYYSDPHVTLCRGDALDVLAALPSGSVDAVVCDPPYSSGGMVRGPASTRHPAASHRARATR